MSYLCRRYKDSAVLKKMFQISKIEVVNINGLKFKIYVVETRWKPNIGSTLENLSYATGKTIRDFITGSLTIKCKSMNRRYQKVLCKLLGI